MEHSSPAAAARKPAKPKKPRKDFPLFPHATGRWAKKVRGKFAYFGKVADDPKGEAALALWLAQKDELLAGRTPRAEDDDRLTLEDLADHFLNAKLPLVDSGELTQRMYDEYFATCKRLIESFGARRLVDDLRPDDFSKLRASASKKWGLHRVAGEVQRVRSIFKFGFDAGHLDRPMKFGPTYKKPSKAVFRKAKAEAGESMIEAAEIRQLLEAASMPLKAMILLGINCGFGNADCGQLTFRAIELKGGWVNFARGKTGIGRRCKLWPETVDALAAAIKVRPTPKDDANANLVFVTKYGKSWFKTTPDSPVSWEFRKLLNELKLHSAAGKGFYWLRHTFETVAGETKDQVAVDAVMGHVRDDMASVYRERISDERLEAVAAHVRAWLFAKEGGAK